MERQITKEATIKETIIEKPVSEKVEVPEISAIVTPIVEQVTEQPEELPETTEGVDEKTDITIPEVENIPVPEENPIITEEITSEEPDTIKEPSKTEEPVIIEEPVIAKDIEYNQPIKQEQPRPRHTPKKDFNFERFIGENLINKIGIAVLVIGIGLFVKYAIDNEWINEIGRVAIGFLSGGILLLLAYKFSKKYRAFSSVLAGGAMATFYFTVAIAFREYELFGQATSFILMVLITGFSVWLSILYNRRELAILSIIGGFLTPFMVSQGTGNYHVLFTYIAILNVGMLTLSLQRQWKELLIICFAGTQIIFWLYTFKHSYDTGINYYQNVALLCYASIFYLIFLLMPLIQIFRSRKGQLDYSLHVILLTANSFLFLIAGIILFNKIGIGDSKGLLSAFLATINGIIAILLYRKDKDTKVLYYLFIGLVLCFVTLTAPLQFEGNYITLFWVTEAVLLLWLFYRSRFSIFYYGSLLLMAGTLVSLIMDINTQSYTLSYVSDNSHLAGSGSIITNQFFITRLYTSIAFLFAGFILRKYIEVQQDALSSLNRLSTYIYGIATVLFFYTGWNELRIYTSTYFSIYWLTAYSYAFIFILSLILGSKDKGSYLRTYIILFLWIFSNLQFWWQYNDFNWARELLIQNNLFGIKPALLYWCGFICLAGIFVPTAYSFYKRYTLKSTSGKVFTWFFNLAAIICLSLALLEAIHQNEYLNDISYIRSSKAGITILWSLCAFIQMWLGMRLKYKTLRIISLTLLALVILKLFLFDLNNVPQGAKIVAFVVLGIVLLVLSFLYQKLKKILFEDDEDENSEQQQ